MVLRFLRMGIMTFILFTVVAVPILIPINFVGQLDSNGLNKLTIGNIKDKGRLWAHLWLSVLLSVGLIFYTYRETRHFLVLRRQHLLDPSYATSVTARTLFIPAIPEKINNVEALTKIFNRFPGGVRRVWITRNMGDLPDIVAKRADLVKQLEAAITNTIRDCYKHYAKKENKLEEKKIDLSIIPEKLRPTHRVSPLPIPIPFIGRKVDSIKYYHDEIKQLNDKIIELQKNPEVYAQLNSAFIEFNQQIAAHMAAQCVSHSAELQMAPRCIQIAPTDIIWDNMNVRSYERLLRRGVSWIITSAIVIFWAIPVTFVQAVSNIESLSKILPFLSALNTLPPTAVGIIQGILPAVALAILISLVPVVFRILSTLEGIPQKSMVDLSLMHKYFFFLFVDVVLVSTIAGGVFQALSALKDNPLSIINTLAETLPKASTFFITYVMLQAFTSGQTLLQLVPLILSYLLPFLGKTPRQIYMRKRTLSNIQLGTLIPQHTVIFVLGIEYSTIAPLILPFVCMYFMLQYFAYLYQFLFVYEMSYESGGLAFPRAIRHVYIGMFTWQLTMIGLFAVNQAVPQLVIMIITLIGSCLSLWVYDKSFKPLFKYLPMYTSAEEEKLIKNGRGSRRASLSTSSDSTPDEENADGTNRRSEVYLDAYHTRSTLRQRLADGMKRKDNLDNPGMTEQTALLMFQLESYMHPSIYMTQPTVWLPKDDLGIAQSEVEALRELSIRTSSQSAHVEHRGKTGGKAKIKIDKELIIDGGKGIPGELPVIDLSKVNDYVRNFDQNLNVIESLALT
ncbi:hypothetical protein BX666DRAFT_1861683 [Dichotomocladium elegans]|nr:hypothetical protein BX666DRAFT_1861683 [Dichotomocladium elegans]